LGSADADARLDRCIGGKRIPPLAGRPGRLAARSLEAMARTGAGSTGLALAPREAEREKARPALPEKALCGLCGSRLPRPSGASRRRKVLRYSGPPKDAMMPMGVIVGCPPPSPP